MDLVAKESPKEKPERRDDVAHRVVDAFPAIDILEDVAGEIPQPSDNSGAHETGICRRCRFPQSDSAALR
jgi:hypothetical protein